VQVTYIPQPEPLGLAHAVLTAEPYLHDEPFLMYLGDNLVTSSLQPLVQAFQQRQPNALILLAEVPNPQEFGVAELAGRARRAPHRETQAAPKQPRAGRRLPVRQAHLRSRARHQALLARRTGNHRRDTVPD
jgi:glucose-1-phosphate thymidylyltransferase